MIDLSELSERERWEYLVAMFREGKGPRAGRPKKNSDIPKWRDLGLTRKQVWRMRRLGEIPKADFEAFLGASSKSPSYRSILVHFGKINVPTENDFDGTPWASWRDHYLRRVNGCLVRKMAPTVASGAF